MPIDRIDNSGYGSTQTADNKKVQNMDVRDNTGSFTLLRDEAGVIYEPGKSNEEHPKTLAEVRQEIAREEQEAARANIHARFDGPGVTVELSEDGASEYASKSEDNSFLGTIKRLTTAIRDFFSAIWNGGDGKPSTGETVTDDTRNVSEADDNGNSGDTGAGFAAPEGAKDRAETLQDVDLGNSEGRSSLNRGNAPEDIAAFMIDYGGGRLAKNSDLLTQYNRHGTIVSLDPTVKKRILRGEGRIRRY